MTFEEILDHTLNMLQRRGWVSYRALKCQFDLDDAYLDDLKAEIIEVLQLAVDQGNTMLVWMGSADTPPAPPLPASPDAPQPAPQAESATAPISHYTLDAERRQLTVMFCDLVDSTSLSTQLDPRIPAAGRACLPDHLHGRDPAFWRAHRPYSGPRWGANFRMPCCRPCHNSMRQRYNVRWGSWCKPSCSTSEACHHRRHTCSSTPLSRMRRINHC
jgi:hypothetical protein